MLFQFENNGYAPLIVRIVMPGDSYGLGMCIVHGLTPDDHASDPLIEFYDARYPHDALSESVSAQFISRYYLSTLQEEILSREAFHGMFLSLNLAGYAPDWTASGATMRDLSGILSHLVTD
jgi:hypothetical protein